MKKILTLVADYFDNIEKVCYDSLEEFSENIIVFYKEYPGLKYDSPEMFIYAIRKWVVEHLDEINLVYDYVLLTENDIQIPLSSVENILDLYDKSYDDYRPGFLLYEEDPDKNRFYLSQSTKFEGFGPAVDHIVENLNAWTTSNIHACTCLLSVGDIHRMIAEDTYETEFRGREYADLLPLDCAVSSPYYTTFTKFIPIEFTKVIVHHTSNKYLKEADMSEENLKLLINCKLGLRQHFKALPPFRWDLFFMERGIKELANFFPRNFMEIGSRDGIDTAYISNVFDMSPENCHILEPHPTAYQNIKRDYPQFHLHYLAASNYDGEIEFHAGKFGEEQNPGASSVKPRVWGAQLIEDVIKVPCFKMSGVLKKLKLRSVDLCKIDVEGHTMEVLEGFEDRIKDVKAIQLELEHHRVWEGQALYSRIAGWLEDHGFRQTHFYRYETMQSDSLWIQERYLLR